MYTSLNGFMLEKSTFGVYPNEDIYDSHSGRLDHVTDVLP